MIIQFIFMIYIYIKWRTWFFLHFMWKFFSFRNDLFLLILIKTSQIISQFIFMCYNYIEWRAWCFLQFMWKFSSFWNNLFFNFSCKKDLYGTKISLWRLYIFTFIRNILSSFSIMFLIIKEIHFWQRIFHYPILFILYILKPVLVK